MKTILTAGSFQFPTPLAPSSATRFSLMAFKSAVSTIDRSTVYSVNSPLDNKARNSPYTVMLCSWGLRTSLPRLPPSSHQELQT